MPVPASANEPGCYAFEGMAPVSHNEPIASPLGTTYPSITSIAPSTAAAASGNFTLVITGTGFVADSAVFFDGRRVTPATLSGTLSVTIQMANFKKPRTVQVQVRNGAYPSNLKPFVFT